MKKMKERLPVRKYDAKMLKDGYTRATAWIPVANKEEFMDIAAEMRQEYKTQGVNTAS